MEQYLLIQSSATELREMFSKEITNHFESLKTYFQPQAHTEYLSRNEVADLLKIDLSTLHNYTKSKKLKSYSLGARVYYKRHEVEASIIPLNHSK